MSSFIIPVSIVLDLGRDFLLCGLPDSSKSSVDGSMY